MPRGKKRSGRSGHARPSYTEVDAVEENRRLGFALTADEEDELLFGGADELGRVSARSATLSSRHQEQIVRGGGNDASAEKFTPPPVEAAETQNALSPHSPENVSPDVKRRDLFLSMDTSDMDLSDEDEDLSEDSPEHDGCDDKVAVWKDEKGVFKFLNAMKLYGFMLRAGSVRLDNESYELVRFHAQLFSADGNARTLRRLRWQLTHPVNPEASQKPLYGIPLSKGVRMLPSVRTINRCLKDMYRSLTLSVSMFRVAIDTSASGALSISRRSDRISQRLPDSEQREAAIGTTRVALVKPSEFVRADMLSKRVVDMKMSIVRGIAKVGEDCIDDNIFVHGRNVLYGHQLSMDAIYPMNREWLHAVQLLHGTDGSWEWVSLRVGERALVHFDRAILPELHTKLEVCDLCTSRARDATSATGFCFDIRDAITMSSRVEAPGESTSRAVVGVVQSMWTVKGASSWEMVNMNIRAESSMEEDVDIVSGTPDVIRRLSNMLHAASRSGEFPGNECLGSYAGHPSRTLPSVQGRSLPWSPLKPGDTVAILSLPESSKRQCLCGAPVWSKQIYMILVNRWWAGPEDIERQALLIRDVDFVVKTIQRNAGDESKLKLCPFGASPKLGGGFDTVFKSPLQNGATGGSSVAAQMRLVAIERERSCHEEASTGSFTAHLGHTDVTPRTHTTDVVIREAIEEAMSKEAPTHGILEYRSDGDHLYYFVERMYLYHDGFNDKVGRADSVIGIYMGSLSLPSENRRCSAHVRVLSLCPPGTDVKAVYSAILEDVLEGAVNGLDCTTSDGKKVRVFLDLMFLLADTPAATEILDIPGHNALYPCHLCNFNIPSEVGTNPGKGKKAAAKNRGKSRYTERRVWGSLAANRRNMIVHQAIRDSGASDKELWECGIVPMSGPASEPRSAAPDNTSGLKVLKSVLPLHDYASKYNEAAREGRLPKDHKGREILPQVFCPYRSVPPAPEHLFCNMYKYTLELALKLFHSTRDARAVQLYLQMYQGMCGMAAQSQPFNVKTRELMTMSMSDTYALSVVADRALFAVADSKSRVRLNSEEQELGLRKAIRLVQSAARIIALFWTKRKAHAEMSGSGFSTEFDHLVDAHVRMIEDLCKKPEHGARIEPGGEREFSATQGHGSKGCTKRRKLNCNGSMLADTMPQANGSGSQNRWPPDEEARSCIDKPYVHRLLELAKCFVPFIGQGSLIAELPCETMHQPSKGLLKQFGSTQEPHVLAVEASVADDYKTRIISEFDNALGYPTGTPEGDSSIRCLVRYLFGREALENLPSKISRETRLKVLNVIGVEQLIPLWLRNHSRPLVSGLTTRAAKVHNCEPQWKKPHKRQEVPVQGSGLGDKIECLVKKAEKEMRKAPVVVCAWLGNVVRCSNGKGLANMVAAGVHNFLRQLKVGSVITCRVRVDGDEDTQSSPFVRTLHEITPVSAASDTDNRHEAVCEDIVEPVKSEVRYFCVLGLYTARVQSTCDSSIQTPTQDSIHAVVVPVVDLSNRPVVATSRSSQYQRMHAQTDSALAVRDHSDSKLWPSSIITLDASDASIKPVAVLPYCEGTIGCGAYTDAKDDKPQIRHGPLCGAEKGGSFFIRDEWTGFPPRSA